MSQIASIQAKATGSSTKRLGLIDSAATLWSLCAKKTSRVTRKLKPEPRATTKLPVARPKHILASISTKAARLGSKKKGKTGSEDGLWRKTILMGKKCDPLDFSGVIYYDSNGKQLDEPPTRSTRASPLPGYLCSSIVRRQNGF